VRPAAGGRAALAAVASAAAAVAHTSPGGGPGCCGGGWFGCGGAWVEGLGRGLQHRQPRTWSELHHLRQPCQRERRGNPGENEKKGTKNSLPRSPSLIRVVRGACGLVPFAACMGHRDLTCTRGKSRLHKYLPQSCCAHNYLPQNTCHRAAARGAHSAERGELTERSMIGQLQAFTKTAR